MNHSQSNQGEVQPFAGTGQTGYKDGLAASSQFANPYGIDVDQQTGDVYVSEFSNLLIRRISKGWCYLFQSVIVNLNEIFIFVW